MQVSKAESGQNKFRFKKKALGLYVQMVPLVCALAVPFSAQVQAEEASREQLLKRIAQLEKQMARMDRLEQRLNELETTAVLSHPDLEH